MDLKQLFISALLCCFAISSWCQLDSTLKVSMPSIIASNVLDFTTDNLNNIYIVTPSNQIKKLNEKGDSIGVYNDVKRYGRISSLDASNPLKLLVYYLDFSTIVVLDRFLNKRNTIDLRRLNMMQVKVITSSYDNNYWVYDELENKLRKIDDNGNTIVESADLRQALSVTPQPVDMYDREGQLYMYDPAQGMFVFDYYGAKRNLWSLLHLSDVQVLDKNTISGSDSTGIMLYKPSSFILQSYHVFDDQKRFKKINFNNNKIYGLTYDGMLEVYAIVK